MNKKSTYIIAAILIATASFFYKLYLGGDLNGIKEAVIKNNDIESVASATENNNSNESTAISEETNSSDDYIQIYICGAIKNPGVYTVSTSNILNDLIVMAGGLTEEAATERINLVYQFSENITIYIPTQQEFENNEYDYQINKTGIILGGNGVNANNEESTITGLVNINTASKDELTQLPGIGETTADKIIRYRETKPFENKEDLLNVSGIGEAKYEAIKDLICI